jgi:phenylacetate-CoA ligase
MFEPELEAMPDGQRAGLQLERLHALVDRLLANGGVQAERLKQAGVGSGPDITSLADLPALAPDGET